MDLTLMWTIIGTGIGSVIAIFTMNIAIFSWLRSDITGLERKFEEKINSLEERMFYLSTGKTLSQAMLEEKMKMENK